MSSSSSTSDRYIRRFRPCNLGDTRVDRIYCLRRNKTARKYQHTPQEEFEKTGIDFYYENDHTVKVHRPPNTDDDLIIAVGEELHTTMSNVPYNVTVTEVVFARSNKEFHKLKVDLCGNLGSFNDANAFNVKLYHRVNKFSRSELENNVEFWKNLKMGHGRLTATPTTRNGSSKSPLPSQEEQPPQSNNDVKLNRIQNDTLEFTNKHDLQFQIFAGSWFRSKVTFQHGIFMCSANLKKTTVSPDNGRQFGYIEGRFANFGPDAAEIRIEGGYNRQKESVKYEPFLEFWQNLEIITHAKRFPNYEFKPTDHDPTHLIVKEPHTHHPHQFKAGTKFDTTIYRTSDWRGWVNQRVNFNLNLMNGDPIQITGKFVSFSKEEATISINYNASGMFLMAGLNSTSAFGNFLTGNFNQVGNIAKTLVQTSHTYVVKYDSSLPFWANLTVEKTYCKLADAKDENKVQAVASAVNPSSSSSSAKPPTVHNSGTKKNHNVPREPHKTRKSHLQKVTESRMRGL